MPNCTISDLAEQNPGFGRQGMNPKQQKAALLYMMVLELAAIGGTDYRSTMATTLISDAKSLEKLNPDQRMVAMIQIARNSASLNGATVPATPSLVNEATACCVQAAPNLDLLILWMTCQLGRHKVYPQ